ncbi:MAG: C40 family peptidase [Lachnospiraceae bacterium]|nr:C40 family peptidase [Lachnospiraceae bacterium]
MMKKIQLAILSAAIAVVVFATSVSAVTIQDLKNGKAQAQSEVAALQQQLETVVTEITKLEDKLVETGAQIEQAEKDLEAAQKQEKKQYEDMKLRIQFMYETGDASVVEEMLEKQSIVDAMTQAEYISNVHSYDRQKLDEYIATKEKIASLKADLETKQAELKKTQEEFVAQQQALDSMIKEKQAVVAGFDQMINQAYAAAARAAAARAAAGQRVGGYSARTGGNGKKAATYGATGGYSYTGGASGYYAAILAAANGYAGTAYRWGGTSKSGIDCSGLVMQAYAAAGISLPHSSALIYQGGKQISNPTPGCIVCEPGHVGIYVGNGQMINATQDGDTVRVTNVKPGSKYVTY